MKLIGKIKDAHGLKGEIYVLVFSGDVSWLSKLKSFGLGELPARGEKPGPNAVSSVMTCERVKPFKDGLILKAKEIADRNAAEAVKGRGFYVPAEFFVSKPGENIYLNEILGFEVRSVSGENLGTVVGFSSNGPQDLLVIRTSRGTEAEIPFVDAFIRDLTMDAKAVIMDLPEGLLDLSEEKE